MAELVSRLGKDWIVLGNTVSLGKRSSARAFDSVAVIGAAGQTGEVFTKSLAPVVRTEAVVREHRWKEGTVYPEVGIHTDIRQMLATRPEAVILAIPNPIGKVLEQVVQHVQKPLVLILPQNGIVDVDQAKEVLAGSEHQISLVRASYFTNVSRDHDGNVLYNPSKNRIALASVDVDQNENLLRAEATFTHAGFQVRVRPSYHSMELSKLVANLLGSTSTITGLPPMEAFSDPQIFALELRALKDRFRILEAAGIQIDTGLWKLGVLRWAARAIPGPVASRSSGFRGLMARMVAKDRNNQLPAAARQINEGARSVESELYYHNPIISLGKKHGLESPVDEAIVDVLSRHGRITNNFSLASLEVDERRKLMLEVFGYETKKLFIGSMLPLKLIVDRLYEHYLNNLYIRGAENLVAVVRTLSQGKSVVIAPNHRSHTDNPTVVKTLRENLPLEARKYPVYIIAGMKFDQEMISGVLNHSYPHPVVCTLSEEDNEEARWKAQIINSRASKVVGGLLEKPSIFVVYPEGGRSKKVVDGKVQLQKPSLGASTWFLNSKVGLVVPTVIRGTEKMLAPGEQRLHHADVTIEFCEAIETDWLRQQGATVSWRDKDKFVSGIVMKRIADKLSAEERKIYGY